MPTPPTASTTEDIPRWRACPNTRQRRVRAGARPADDAVRLPRFARFLADVLGLPDPRPSGPFLAVDVDDTFTVHHGGRGLYFDDPGGHHLEVITARYGR